MRKLYLHVGVHRTGTTSTQKVISDNFTKLLQRGYLCPYGLSRHDEMVRRLRSGRVTAADWAADLQRRAESHPVPVHSVILSDEDMSLIEDFRIFAPFADRFEVKVVLMMRRQDLWLESWYLQNVKWQWDARMANLSFDDFLARRQEFHWIDYDRRLAHYEAIFGPGSVIPGVFERAEMPGGPSAALFRLMGIDDPAFAGPEVHSNSSLSPLMSEFVRQLPLFRMAEQDRRLYEIAAQDADDKLQKGRSKLVLTHEQRAQVLAQFAPGNRMVAQKYFGRDELFREPPPAPSEPLAERELPGDAATLIRDFVAPMMMALGRQITDQRDRMELIQRAMEEVKRHATEATQIKRLPERV